MDVAYYRQVVDALNDAVYIVNTEGRIQFCNATFERLTGYSRRLAWPLLCRPHAPADWPVFLERRCRSFAAGRYALPRGHIIPQDGMPIPVELSITNYLQGEAIAGRGRA